VAARRSPEQQRRVEPRGQPVERVDRVDVAALKRDPLVRPQSRLGGEHDHRPGSTQLRVERVDLVAGERPDLGAARLVVLAELECRPRQSQLPAGAGWFARAQLTI